MHIKLPSSVKMVLDSLEAAGFEAYAVGGCVRDSVLGRTPDDWDVTTSALPMEIKRVFRRTVDTGIEHGTVTVLIGEHSHEVTTYRIDGSYRDFRHPDKVSFTTSLKEDLARRDFTVNAMAYNEREGLVDIFGGMDDLQRKVIRCVGDPMERFSEDALRILRAVRFSAQLGFSIDAGTREAVRALAQNLSNISAERIATELIKLITSDHPEELKTAQELGITRVILPEFDRMLETPQNTPYHYLNVGEHTLRAMGAVQKDKVLRLTMLLHDSGKPEKRTTDRFGIDHFKGHADVSVSIADRVMRRLKLDNDTIGKVKVLIRYHDWRLKPEKKQVRRAMATIGEELFPYLMQVQYADAIAQSDYIKEETLQRIMSVWEVSREILRDGECISLSQLAITGKDLIAIGYRQGPGIGKTLHQALDAVLDEPEKNDREFLLLIARQMLRTELQDSGDRA
jgi:tRNA nucleotidyltransferase (CCA-adding enzyme)